MGPQITDYCLRGSLLLQQLRVRGVYDESKLLTYPVLRLRIFVQILQHLQYVPIIVAMYIPVRTLITCTALDLMPHHQCVWLFTQQVLILQADAD